MYENISVELIDKMGTDNTVVDAARVSFSKEAANYTEEQNNKLIKYLAKHNHWSPFAHCTLQFRIKAPIFVARQLQKHQVGFAWNEVSRRYVDYDPTFWNPNGNWRKKAENKKQGSMDNLVDDPLESQDVFEDAMRYCMLTYNLMLANGVCPEQARAVLPQSMMTEWYWTGSLYGFARVCQLRLDAHAQNECRQVAMCLDNACAQAFPMSWKALNGTVD
jgi:thymidylate synthase (FAD)